MPRDPIQTIVETPDYVVRWVCGAEEVSAEDDNVDVFVDTKNGRRYFGTFFTLDNVDALMKNWELTGECADGRYFRAAGAIIVRRLTREDIAAVVADLYARDELGQAFHTQAAT